MQVGITGSHGLVGSALREALPDAVGLACGAPLPPGLDAVVHLAGENIGAGRWTAARKAAIRDSRAEGTRRIAGDPNLPKVLVCASAVGFYGDRGGELLTEESAPGAGFLPEVCRAWEAAADPARARGIRVVHLRFGIVLSAKGGALAKMLLPFRMGAGGRIGPGRQWWSWLAIDDAVGIVRFVLEKEVAGALNAASPNTATNGEFTRALARNLRRPAVLPMPAFAARLALGEMADALLLCSARAMPVRLLAEGFAFRRPHLDGALRNALAAEADAGA